ncbi:MAG: hypothetical protein WCO06_01540 [Candidatus Roizmanbacteria bacterium]
MATNPMFSKFDQILGKTTPTPTDGTLPVTSRADQIRALAKKSLADTEANKPKPAFGTEPSFKASIGGAETIVPNTLKTLGNIPSDVANIADTAIQSTAGNIGKSLGVATDIYKDRGVVQGTKDIVGGFADTLTKIGEAPGKAIVGQNDKMDLVNHLAPIQETTLKQRDAILQKIDDAKKNGKDTTNLVKALKYTVESLDSLNAQIGTKEDRSNQTIDTLTNVAKYPIEHPAQTAILAETLKPETQATIVSKIKPVTSKIETGVNAVKNTASDLAGATGSKISDVTSSTKGEIINIIKGKSEAEILATPESKVKTLSPSERKVWFDNQTSKINTNAEATTAKIKADLKKQADATQATTEKLQKDLAVATRDKVIELRPKIVKAMGEQSKIYRNLINEEMAGKENISIKIDDLKAHIDAQFGDNPGQASAIKERLGLTDTPEVVKKGQVPTIQAEAPTKTLGELFDESKALKQEISTGATKGTKVFTSEDKLTDDAIHTLTDFMKKNGVDFKEANQFWSKYAPIRNQLVSEAKPFLQTGTQTKTFAGTLKRVSQGTDVNNENFINEVENLVGKPITKEAKEIVSKLDATAKTELANKISAEQKLLENQMAKDKALSELSSKQFEIERQARVRSMIKKVVITSLGLLGAKELGITKFFGL